jgi:hypothetical protein
MLMARVNRRVATLTNDPVKINTTQVLETRQGRYGRLPVGVT